MTLAPFAASTIALETRALLTLLARLQPFALVMPMVGAARVSAGIGVQWLSPLGLFRVSYGFPLRYQSGSWRDFSLTSTTSPGLQR